MNDYTMSARTAKLAILPMITMIFLSFALANIDLVFPSGPGGKVDIFTQKKPFNGLGPNVQSDAFAPGEEVQISAFVTYNEYPVASLLVAFAVSGPGNPFGNITLYRTAFTDEAGVARTSFRISHLNQTTFGGWKATGSTIIGEIVVQDTVTFRVGWIVEIVSAKTVNEQLVDQTEFMRGNYAGVELTLRNIAMTERNATLTVTVYDPLGVRVDSMQMIDFTVKPNATPVTVHFFMHIPENAVIGNASVFADAYTAPEESSGVPYCPEVSTHFSIVARRYFLRVKTDPIGIVMIAGEGWYNEYATVDLVAPTILTISTEARYRFSYWDVNGVSKQESVNAISILMNTSYTATAHYVLQYFLTVKVDPPGITAISGESWYNKSVAVTLSAPSVAGYQFSYWDIDNITQGNMTRSVTIIMNSSHIATAHYTRIKYQLTVETTAGGTTNPKPGTHVYNASTTVQVTALPNVNYVFDHWELDGVSAGSAFSFSVLMNQDLTLKAVFSPAPPSPPIWVAPGWLYWFLLLLLLTVLLILLILWLYRRRKKSRESFYSGWTAWYYGYDRSDKRRKRSS